MATLFAPLRPPVFEETATMYFVTESAYLTREAALELSATSEMMTLPPEDLEPMPGDPDYTPPPSITPLSSSSGLSEVRLIQLRVTESTVTGISSRPLERHSCPSPSAHISGQFPPNQAFRVLGWNVDLDNITYLLIEDDPTKPQVWLRIPDLTVVQTSHNYLDTPTIACRTYVLQTSQTLGPVTATVSNAPNGTAATAAIPLPQIASATPPAPTSLRLEITEQDAVQQVLESVPELHNPEIEIHPEYIEIRGNIDLPGPLGTTIKGDVVINAELVQEDADLRVAIRSVSVAGRDITNTDDARQVENTINNWLNTLLIRRDVQSFEMREALLIINVLERQFSVFPELPEQTEESNATTIIPSASPIVTITLLVSTVTSTQPTTPLPVWTQTPSPTQSTSTGG